MKKFIFLLTAFAMIAGSNALATDLTGKKIYVNPGHGGYDPTNDRNIPTIPFAAGDHNGFYESSCNLVKGLELARLLQESGATVMLSRTQNRDEDDKVLTEISAEADAFGANAFISVHSNALGANAGTNYLLTLYKGNENAAAGVPWKAEDKEMATKSWPFLYENNTSIWTSGSLSNPIVRDDYHFLGFYLGVMRTLTSPGFLVEGSFHDYEPETHRLLNEDYAKMTAVNLHRFYLDYYGADAPTTGEILGSVKDSQRVMDNTYFNNFVKRSHDQYQPINGATVTLMNSSGSTLSTYTTDNYYNGIYVFRDLAPGTYKVRMEAPGYITQEKEVTVEAAKTTSFYTLLEDPTYEPPVKITAVPNIYASELSAGENGEGQYTLSFTLNADATAVQVKVYNETGDPIIIDAGALPRGRNNVLVNMANVKGSSVKWEVIATGEDNTLTEPAISSDPETQPLSFKQTRGIAVDNSMESEYFGRVYITEGSGGSTGYRTTKNGLYVLDATLSDVTGQGANSYAGNVAWASSSSPMRPAVGEDGSIYLADWSDGHSGVWKANPANLGGDFTPIFGGTRDSDGLMWNGDTKIAGSISSCYAVGSGENTILYTVDEDYLGTYGASNLPQVALLQYNIGNAETPWVNAPSALLFDNPVVGDYAILSNANCVIIPQNGGFWVSQYRWSDGAALPSLSYIKNNEALFKSGTVDASLISTSQRGALALNYDGTMIAVGAGDETRVFNVTFNGDVPSISPLYVIDHGLGGNSFGLAFDYANNLYLANDASGVAEFTLPTTVNSRTTVAPKSQYLKGVAAKNGDLNGDGECTGSDVTALYNFILYNDTSAIVNGDQNGDGEITGSDVTAVYNIILGL